MVGLRRVAWALLGAPLSRTGIGSKQCRVSAGAMSFDGSSADPKGSVPHTRPLSVAFRS